MDNKKQQQNPGAQQGNIDNERDSGNKSDLGSTSSDLEKSRLETVSSNEDTPADSSGIDINTPGGMADNRSGIGPDDNDIVDAGYTRTAAFDMGNEPRGNKPDDTSRMSDKGDMGKQGSMKDSFRDEEGYRTMDTDENTNDGLKKGDNKTMGNP
jgi:hypothetical protein